MACKRMNLQSNLDCLQACFSYYLGAKWDMFWPEEFLIASPAAFIIGQVD